MSVCGSCTNVRVSAAFTLQSPRVASNRNATSRYRRHASSESEFSCGFVVVCSDFCLELWRCMHASICLPLQRFLKCFCYWNFHWNLSGMYVCTYVCYVYDICRFACVSRAIWIIIAKLCIYAPDKRIRTRGPLVIDLPLFGAAQ